MLCGTQQRPPFLLSPETSCLLSVLISCTPRAVASTSSRAPLWQIGSMPTFLQLSVVFFMFVLFGTLSQTISDSPLCFWLCCLRCWFGCELRAQRALHRGHRFRCAQRQLGKRGEHTWPRTGGLFSLTRWSVCRYRYHTKLPYQTLDNPGPFFSPSRSNPSKHICCLSETLQG